MTKKLNIVKDYIVDKNIESTFEMLDSIVSTKYNNYRYSTYGNFISADPPIFSFMTKWYSLGRPLLAGVASTKLEATISKIDNKSIISISTKTNPGIIIVFFIFTILYLIKLLAFNNSEGLKSLAAYLILVLVLGIFDRFMKVILIERFERDIQIK